MSTFTSSPILVTGAAGHLGRLVVSHLLDTLRIPAAQIIATSRKPAALADLAARGVSVRAADFDRPETLAAAFAGAGRVLIISTDTLDRPGARLAQHRAAIAAAKQAGASHVVYTSMPKPEPGSPVLFAPDHFGTEQELKASGLGWTVLRNTWYAENLFFGLPHALQSGALYTAAGEGRIAHVSRDDCALVAATVLASGSTANVTLEVTGPQAYSTAETAQAASEITGRPIKVVQVTPEQFAQGLAAAGVPAGFVPLLVSFDANTKLGNLSQVTDTVQRLTGRQPKTLRDFLVAQKAALLGTAGAAASGH